MNSLIENNKQQIIELCQRFKVKELYAFGSVVRGDFNVSSDIDFLASFNFQPDPDNVQELEAYFSNQDSLTENLKKLFNREVDLLVEKNIRNKYLKRIITKERKLIYAEA